MQSRLAQGDLLQERYVILSVLGKGGMGTVYLVQDTRLRGKLWAIKESIHRVDYQQFIDEAQMLVTLNHPNLPQIVDYYPPNQDGYSYLVMDYVKGSTLLQVFEQAGKELEVDQVLNYMLQLCDVLHYLHRHQPTPIIYRDIKPANVMIDEQDQVKLIDFGIARNYTRGKGSDTVQMGTVGFAAPEQFENKQTDHRTDLFSLGAMMYYLLSCGKYFYTTQKPLDQVRQDLPAQLVQLSTKLLQMDPNLRYQSALELKKELEECRTPTRRLPSLAAGGTRSKRGLLLFLLLLLTALASTTVYWAVNGKQREGASKSAIIEGTQSFILYEAPLFAQRKVILRPDPREEARYKTGQFEWQVYDHTLHNIATLHSSLGQFNGSVTYEFPAAGEYIVELYDKSSEAEGQKLSSTTLRVLPPPKVWFQSIKEKEEKLLVNQRVEFRGIRMKHSSRQNGIGVTRSYLMKRGRELIKPSYLSPEISMLPPVLAQQGSMRSEYLLRMKKGIKVRFTMIRFLSITFLN